MLDGNASAESSGREQLSGALQSRTWKRDELLELLFQPADFLTKLNVIHPAETQREPLREERVTSSRGAPNQHQKAMQWGAQIYLPSHGKWNFISELLVELHGLCHWLLAKKRFHCSDETWHIRHATAAVFLLLLNNNPQTAKHKSKEKLLPQ